MSITRLTVRPTTFALRTVSPFRMMSNTAPLKERGTSEEERFVWEQQKDQIKKLRAQLAEKETSAKAKLDAAPHIDPEFHAELKDGSKARSNATASGSGDAFSKRESAAENRYIHEQEHSRKK
ncbi:hypothetical protein HKX48_000855 [Thoreauomyces humboldtii]|nr:hypothetical protein HKX48_000855 [Thoreauomyces humboldtii]